MGAISATIQLGPAYRPFDLGAGYVYAATTAMPNFFLDVHPAADHHYRAWLAGTIAPGYAATGGNGLTDTSPDASRYRPGLGGKAKRLAAFWAGHREALRMAAAIPELRHGGYSGPSCALPGSDEPR